MHGARGYQIWVHFISAMVYLSNSRSTALANPFIIYTALTSPSDFGGEFPIQTYPLTSMVVGTKMIFNTSTARERNLWMYSSHVATMSWRETLSSRRRRHASCRMLCCKDKVKQKVAVDCIHEGRVGKSWVNFCEDNNKSRGTAMWKCFHKEKLWNEKQWLLHLLLFHLLPFHLHCPGLWCFRW